jgi:hypothetical protein
MPEDEEEPRPEDEHESFQPRVNITIDDDEESDDDDMSDNGDAEDMFVSALLRGAAWFLIPLPAIGFWRYPNIGCTTAL